MTKPVSLVLFIFSLSTLIFRITTLEEEQEDDDNVYTNSWAVHIDGGLEVADRIAAAYGFVNKGQVGSLTGYYHFVHEESPTRSRRSATNVHSILSDRDEVLHAEQQVVLTRRKRDYITPIDPQWNKQWYMHRTDRDMNVKPVWELGITGKGSVVSILDDGIEHTHPDLKDNYDPDASYDFNSHDSDPIPRYERTNENKHGTRCAGEVSAAKNDVCTVGVAYKSSIGGVRMLDGQVTDVTEASSLSLNPQHIHIYSSSWGPDDDGRTVDGPGRLAKKAFLDGVTKGRDGLGSIYVWASGNGGASGDSCNCDGYAVSPYTLAISSVTENDNFPWYAEKCSSNLACTYSSGSGGEHQVISTDLHHKCTTRHTGTSASAPMAAGLLALVLEVNRNLTWRDIQYIVVYSSNPTVPKDSGWATNGAGLRFSHQYGFGLMDASALVNRARYWSNVPERQNCTVDITTNNHKASKSSPIQLKIVVTKDGNCPNIGYLEHIQAFLSLSIDKGKRGQVQISLQSPHHTKSVLLPFRKNDYKKKEFKNWPFMTVFSWGEDPVGEWLLMIMTEGSTEVTLKEGIAVFHGVSTRPRVIRNIPEKCSSECERGCAKEGPQYCDTCKNYRVLTTMECVPTCPGGTYPDQTTCRPCLDNCASCTNDTVCIQCNPGSLKASSSLCLNKCPVSTYQALENNTCFDCHSSCMSCTGPTPHNCTQCLSNQYHLMKGACVLETNCDPGKYFDSRSFECRSCDESCAECDGREGTDCNACYPGRVLSNGQCVFSKSSCRKGEYLSEKTGSCAICPPGCSECSDTISCSKCHSGYFLHDSRTGNSDEIKVLCLKKCPAGFYGDHEKSCSQCAPFCGTCNSTDFCLTCALSESTPLKGACPQPCGYGEFFNTKTGSCQDCSGNCKTCISDKVCASCKENLLLDEEGSCVEHCPEKTVTNEVTGRCESTNCHPSCLTCSGPEPDQCLTCGSNHVLNQQVCMDSCPDGQVLVTDSCIECDPSCLTCAGVTDSDCLSCKPDVYLDDHSCVDSCRHGTFIKDNLCLACPTGCLLCKNSTHCNKCDDSYILYKPSNKCLTNCPTGYYPGDDNICHPCIFKGNCSSVNHTNGVPPTSSSNSSAALVLFLVVLGALITSLVVILLLWKRERISELIKRKNGNYRVLYTAPDKLDVNGIMEDLEEEESGSETEMFSRY